MSTGFIERIAGWLGFKPQPPVMEREVLAGEFGDLSGRFSALSAKLGLAAPRLVVSDNPAPNASYTPADDTVHINRGSLERFTKREQDSELAHELGHKKDRLEHPQFAPQRLRELRADAIAIAATADPDARISGLRKIEEAAHHDRAAMQGKLADRYGPHTAGLYAGLPDFAQGLVQESSYRWRQLKRKMHLDRHPSAAKRYTELEAMRSQMDPLGNER